MDLFSRYEHKVVSKMWFVFRYENCWEKMKDKVGDLNAETKIST